MSGEVDVGVGIEKPAGTGSLGMKAAGGAMWVGAAQACRTAFMVIATLFVARLLTPDDYGVVAMVAPVAAFVLLIQDLGLSQAVIQAREVREDDLTAIFWLNMIIGALIGALLIVTAPLIGHFYKEGRVMAVIAASAIPVLITSGSLQHIAILSREMDFRSVALSDFANAVTTLLASVLFALLLHSYWAIWLGQLFGVAAQALVVWTRSKWRPRFSIRFAGIGKMLRFGGGVTGYNVLNYVVRNLDNILIARRFGAFAVGTYDQSYKLMMAPMQAINSPLSRVMMPVLSRLSDDPIRYRKAFLQVVKALLLVLTPALAVLVAMSNEIIVMLLGAKWAAAGPVFFWLSLAGLFQPLANATGWLFLSSGRTQEMLYWAIFSAVVTALGFVIGLHWGPAGVAASLFVTLVVRMPILFWWSAKGTSVKTFDMYRVLFEPLAGALLTIIATLWMRSLGIQNWWLLTISVPLAYALSFGLLLMSKSGRGYLIVLKELGLKILNEVLAKTKKAPSGTS